MGGVPFEGTEKQIAQHRHVQNHTHGLWPQVLHVAHYRNPVGFGVFGHGSGYLVGRQFHVDQVVGMLRVGLALQVSLDVTGGHLVAADPLEVDVLIVGRLIDEDDVERLGTIGVLGVGSVTVPFLPMLERRGNQVHIVALLGQHGSNSGDAGVALDLIRQADVEDDDGDALFGALHVCSLPLSSIALQ